MAWKSFSLLLFTAWSLFSALAEAQAISTDTSVPPLQWINLSGLLQGSSSPPPLKDAAIGYDESRLNLETLTWSVPNPPNNLQRIPAARSAAIYGTDLAASKCVSLLPSPIDLAHLCVVDKVLLSLGEYDFNNKFWSEVNVSPGPLPRWGAAGGIDLATLPIQDPSVPGPNNTFYLAGGFDGIRPSSLSDVWRLNISGTLSSNLPNDSNGSWDHLTIGNLPSKYNVSGTVVGHQVVLTGGCSSLSEKGVCEGEQDTYVIDAQRLIATPLSVCPAPRTGPVLVRNSNSFTSTFTSQVYLLLGTLNNTRWNDDNGLDDGEVAILDIQTGTWSRILPSGDPGTSGEVTFPRPREGSAAFSFHQALVGSSRNISSDTLIFGGQDSSGNFLSEIWLLRAYNGLINPSQPRWSGFGDGHLQTGINANGAGVSVEYITQCASEIGSEIGPTPTSASHPTASATKSNLPSSTVPAVLPSSGFNTSVAHKALSPVSLAIFQVAFILFRFSSPLFNRGVLSVQAIYSLAVLLILAYGSGIAGLVIAFISISSQDPRKGSLHLRTGHGIASLIFFALLYIALPGLLLLYVHSTQACGRTPAHDSEGEKDEPPRNFSPEVLQNYDWPSRSAPQSLRLVPSSPSSPRHRTNSWGPSSVMYHSRESRVSSDSDSVRSPSPKRGFEVVNRPPRTRRTSLLGVPSVDGAQERLREMDWLRRRRSLNTVGELDYALSQFRRAQSSTPATTDGLMAAAVPPSSQPRLKNPAVSEMVIHAIIQGLFLGLSILTLMNLWSRAPKYGFVIFLTWTAIFYAIMIYFALRHRPESSFLSALCSLHNSRARNMPTDPTPPFLPEGPYVHQPSHRLATAADEISSQGGPRSTETDEQEDDIDDDTRQRIIEEEMGRRDVSIITIPKRKLWITNP
ncbi:hypothetical protein C0995_014511 [Termitomyces sp. Mi166|nr:hypothetical protein C0995_014511 [Termitomyces sp. Mi166\